MIHKSLITKCDHAHNTNFAYLKHINSKILSRNVSLYTKPSKRIKGHSWPWFGPECKRLYFHYLTPKFYPSAYPKNLTLKQIFVSIYFSNLSVISFLEDLFCKFMKVVNNLSHIKISYNKILCIYCNLFLDFRIYIYRNNHEVQNSFYAKFLWLLPVEDSSTYYCTH